ncbi:MAG: NAD-dependent epimerase/dehydratase family protein [Candidatus Baldrarchaeia archaeon]
MAKILVTGGLGFIGSALTRELRRRGHEVWICDIIHAPDPKSIRCDVSKFRQLERVFEIAGDFEFVYHLAAEYGRWNGEHYYENLWLTNVVGTKNLIRLQERKKFKMIFFSSAEVYGDYQEVMREDIPEKIHIHLLNDYAMTKWVGEMMIKNSAMQYGTETVIIRPFNVYGPGEHYHPYRGFIPKFIYHALRRIPYTVYLGHKRTLEYIDDFVEAVANVVDNFKAGEVYNIGGDEVYEVKYISDLVLKCVGRDDSIVTYKEAEPFTTKVKIPDSTKAKRDLGWRPKIKPEEGIPRTVEWFKKNYGE